jgi:Mce-associated membrane protein
MARLAAQPRLTRPGAGNAEPDSAGSAESTQDAPQRTVVAPRQETDDAEATAAPAPGGGATAGAPAETTAATETAAATEEPAPAAKPAEPRTPVEKRTRIALIAGAVLALVALGAAIWTGVVWGLGAAAANDRENALAAGRQAAVNLVSVNFNTADADIQRVRESSTGDFQSLFGQNTDSYAGVVKQGKVISTGQVTEAGVESLDGDDAHVLVGISSKVQNTQVPQGETRQYRVDMAMRYTDGAWKVAQMEFIP